MNIETISDRQSSGLANTQGQPLVEHCFAVGYLAHRILKALVNDMPLLQATFVAGVLHDLGKLDPVFQAWVAGKHKKSGLPVPLPEQGQHIDRGPFSFEKHARHNEISLLLYTLLDDAGYKIINRQNKALIKHVVYWHHAKPLRKQPSQLLDPVCLPHQQVKEGSKRLKRISLRGNSRYVQMAKLQIRAEDDWRVLNQYISEDEDNDDLLTLSVDEIEGYDAMGDNNLIRYMHQKHHKIMSAKTGVKHKKAYKLFMLEKQAIDPENPIYLSYTQTDLERCHDNPHSHAIYYAVSDNQPIGALSRHKLTSIS